MKYKINDEVQFKANSVDRGKVISFEEETSMYSIELLGGNVIRCTEHYITEPKPDEEEED
tara:strand:+ start:499 stop:678 length:180 start_codon:yes stop_codon:yes gene_type:complete